MSDEWPKFYFKTAQDAMRAVMDCRYLETYDWIVAYIDEHQHAPTQMEIAAAFDLSQRAIRKRLLRLRALGYLTWDKGKWRDIRLNERAA